MIRINFVSVAAVAALSAIVSGFAAPSAFAKDDTKGACCGMSCCQPASSCCPSGKAIQKTATMGCCAPGAACCQPGASCCAGKNIAAKAKAVSSKAAKQSRTKNVARS